MTGWRKSRHSGGANNDCVETTSGNGVILVRDTKDRLGFTLEVPAEAWSVFTASLQ